MYTILTGMLFFSATVFSSEKGYSAYNDSTGKDVVRITERHYKAKPVLSFRDAVVSVANNEYNKWRSDSVLREDDSAATSLVRKYWGSVGWAPKTKDIRDSLWEENHPWSAVFISWVMKTAGAGSQFKYATCHSAYIVWTKKNMAAKKSKAMFNVYEVCDKRAAWPEPGDLLCKNRDGKTFSLNTITATDISHSDIVVEVNKETRTIVTIGGNVRNTVNKRIIHLDADGYIERTAEWQITDDEVGNPAGSQYEFFAVIKIKH